MASHIYFFIFLSYKTRFSYKSREKHLKFSVKVQLRILKQLTIVQKFRFKWLRHVYKYAVSNEMISQYYKYPVCCTPLLFFGCVALTSLATITQCPPVVGKINFFQIKIKSNHLRFSKNQIKSFKVFRCLKSNQIKSHNFWEGPKSNQIKSST